MNKKRFSQVFNYVGDNKTIGLTKDNLFRLNMYGKYTRGKGNNVTDFSGWVFNSLHRTIDKLYNQDNGKQLERVIINKRNQDYIRKNYGISLDWELEYHDLDKTQNKVFKISRLIFRDKILYGKPDIVFRNKLNNDRIIIELKSTSGINIDIPEDGWINMKCQLWSYSFIDEFQDSKNIFLVGDIHRVYYHENQIIFSHEKSPSWWFKKDGLLNFSESGVKDFHNQCSEIFNIYGGRQI